MCRAKNAKAAKEEYFFRCFSLRSSRDIFLIFLRAWKKWRLNIAA